MCSMSRSRSGLFPSMTAPRGSWSIWLDDKNGKATMSSAIPYCSQRSRVRCRSSAVQAPFAPGSGGYPQMWLTPCRLKYCSIRGLVGPCWVPTCIFTGLPERLRPSGCGATPPARVASPRSSAAPVPMSETNDLRFITTAPGSCGTGVGTDSSRVLEDRPTAEKSVSQRNRCHREIGVRTDFSVTPIFCAISAIRRDFGP